MNEDQGKESDHMSHSGNHVKQPFDLLRSVDRQAYSLLLWLLITKCCQGPHHQVNAGSHYHACRQRLRGRKKRRHGSNEAVSQPTGLQTCCGFINVKVSRQQYQVKSGGLENKR